MGSSYSSRVRPAPPRGDSHTLYREAGDREVATTALNDLGYILFDYWGRRKAFKAAKREEARERVREIPVSCAEVDVEDGWCALGHNTMAALVRPTTPPTRSTTGIPPTRRGLPHKMTGSSSHQPTQQPQAATATEEAGETEDAGAQQAGEEDDKGEEEGDDKGEEEETAPHYDSPPKTEGAEGEGEGAADTVDNTKAAQQGEEAAVKGGSGGEEDNGQGATSGEEGGASGGGGEDQIVDYDPVGDAMRLWGPPPKDEMVFDFDLAGKYFDSKPYYYDMEVYPHYPPEWILPDPTTWVRTKASHHTIAMWANEERREKARKMLAGLWRVPEGAV
ncbi:unnamed protein product [Vitrella brassicaformis CCMP3155]|uniref:Uncharacterized protein n=1 Tax=Vitrella brassicaformis (strain CCMP3155) TaxID=1169540 RepID=A0A0G4GC34_VITBC|nr:unnamed protein product [Vitrella brassicaformis CCMP3155]|eukprot:CEM26530.1 unnamed protein product [Vitrella brassicaformis CCMP3155]